MTVPVEMHEFLLFRVDLIPTTADDKKLLRGNRAKHMARFLSELQMLPPPKMRHTDIFLTPPPFTLRGRAMTQEDLGL